MRVVHVVTRTNIGGVSSYIDNLATGLGEHVDVTLVRGVPSADEEDYFAGRVTAMPIVDMSSLRRHSLPWHDVISLVRLIALFRRLRPDVVHTHMAKAGALGRIAAFIARVPVRIHTFHGHLLQGYFSGAKTRIIVGVERTLRRITTHSVVIGERVRADLVDIGITTVAASTMIPPAVPAPKVAPRATARQRLGLPPDATIAGFVGRLAPIKRPDRFVALARQLPDVHFAFVGEGELSDEVRSAARGLSNVSFLGWINDVAEVYSAIDIAVLTSDNEGMPVSLIEAAAAGLPIVATNVGAVPEVVHDKINGILADNDTHLTAAVRLLADRPDLRGEYGAAGSAMAATEFTVAGLVGAHVALYSRLVAESSNYKR